MLVRAAGQALGSSVSPPLPAGAAVATAAWPTIGTADGGQTLSVTATDRAGNTATLNRAVIVDNTPPTTRITNAPSTTTQPTATFTFTGADNLTPVPKLQFSWSLDAGPSSTFGPATTVTVGPLTPGPHVFAVRARDLAGNEDSAPARHEFVVAATGITISEPAAMATVPVGPLLVRGSVDGFGAGVSVNGFAAFIAGSQWAVELPAVEGTNVLTAVAVFGDGTEATTSLTVTGAGAEPPVTLRAEPASGLAPLSVTWHVTSRAPRPLVKLELDPMGTGAYGAPAPTLDQAETLYTTPGLLTPTLRATDDQGQVYIARTLVQVDDPVTATARFQSLWSTFLTRLQTGDQVGALEHLTPGLRPQFATLFQRLGADLPSIAAAFSSIDLIDQVDDVAETALIQVEDSSAFLYFVYFRRDNRGRWLIQEM
jgi:hypothetical protein